MAEWLDSKLNEAEDHVYERLNTMIETQMSTKEEKDGDDDESSPTEEQNLPKRDLQKKLEKGKTYPLVSRKSQMRLGMLPPRMSTSNLMEQSSASRRNSKTLSRRISMTTAAKADSDFAGLR